MTESVDMLAHCLYERPGEIPHPPTPFFYRFKPGLRLRMNRHFANLSAHKRMFKYATAHCEAARKRRTHNSILSTSRAFEVFFFEETANVMTNALIASGFISGPWVRLFLTTGICEPLNKYGIEIARYNEKTQLIVLRDFEKINASGLRFNSETLRRDNVCHSRNLRTRINPVDWESAQSSLRIAHISYTALARNRH